MLGLTRFGVARCTAAVLGVCVGLLLCSAAHAQSGEHPAYEQTIAEAVREFSAQRFEEARALFKRAHELAPSARTLRGLGMTAYELRMYVQTMRELEAALRDTRKPLTEEQRNHASSLIAKSREFVGRVLLQLLPADATALVDGQPAEVEAGGVLLLDVGTHVIGATAADHKPSNVRVRVEGGSEQLVKLALEPVAPPALEPAVVEPETPAPPVLDPELSDRPKPVSGDGSLSSVGWIALAGAGAFGITSAAFWLVGDSQLDELKTVCMDSCSEQQIDDSGIETSDALTNVFLGLSALSGGVAIVMFAIDAGSGEQARGDGTVVAGANVRLAPGALRVEGRF
jgi:hypothetical protein